MEITAPAILEIGALLLAAAAAGWVARRLGLPAVVGYLAVGLAISPFTPGLFGPRTYALLDGGSGIDRWDTEGNGPIIRRTAETEDDSIEDPFAPFLTSVSPAPSVAPISAASKRAARLK